MRILVACLALACACGASPKKDNGIVEGSDVAPTCCCKTIPQTAEKEIIPNYAQTGRMECSTQQGECVDTVQCDGQTAPTLTPTDRPPGAGDTGVPPPPVLGSASSSAPAVP